MAAAEAVADQAVAALTVPQFTGSAILDTQEPGQSPLVALLEQLYNKDERTLVRSDTDSVPAASELPVLFADLPVFTYQHECALLREPFGNGKGAKTRPCVCGDACIGMHKQLAGHNLSGGIVLSEMMTPDELAAFMEDGTLPSADKRRLCILCARFNINSAYLFARKKRLFSASHIFNSYVNVAGEPGQYRADCCLPMAADGGAWLGVLGSVVALRLDALQLRCDVDANYQWYVDQSALQQGFCHGLVRSTASIRTVRFDAREWLARFYANRTDVTDRDLLFDEVDNLKIRHTKIPAPPHERYLAWNQAAVKSFSHRLLYYRVNRLNELLDACGQYYGRDWFYTMQIFIDGHIPMVELFERCERVTSFTLKYPPHEETLPDATMEITNAAMGGNASSLSHLTAVMLRCLPELAQPKSFNELLGKHAGSVGSFTHAVALCAMLGNYRASVAAPHSFAVRKALITRFTLKACAAAMRGLEADRMFFFFAYREYIGTVLYNLPCVEALLEAQVAFAKQRSRIADALRAARNAGPRDYTDFIEELNDTYKRCYKRLPKRKSIPRGRGDRSGALCAVLNRSVKKRGLKRTAGNAFDVDVFNTAVKRFKAEGLAAADHLVDEQVQIAAEAARFEAFTDQSKKTTGYHLQGEETTVKLLSDIAFAADAVRGVVRVPLPPAMARAQLEAIGRRFGVEITSPLVQRVSRVLFCMGCGSCKNFVCTRAERTSKPVNARAAGLKKISLNYLNPEAPMRCIERDDCGAFTVEPHDMVALQEDGSVSSCVLVTRKMALTVSPCCGFLTHANAVAANINSAYGFDCPNCAAGLQTQHSSPEPDARACAFCSRRIPPKHVGNTILLTDEKGGVFKYGFCKSHFRTWARTHDGYCSLDFVQRNMGNRRGDGLVLPS
jgi:hypothetical protein